MGFCSGIYWTCNGQCRTLRLSSVVWIMTRPGDVDCNIWMNFGCDNTRVSPLITQRLSSVCDTHVQFIQRFTRTIISMLRTNALSEMFDNRMFVQSSRNVRLTLFKCYSLFPRTFKSNIPLNNVIKMLHSLQKMAFLLRYLY